MHCFASENQTYTGTWLFGVESWKSLKGQGNLLLKNLRVKIRVKNVWFLWWRIFFEGKYGIQSTNEMAFKRTVYLREFSISRHQIWCAHAIVVQRIHACACKMPSCSHALLLRVMVFHCIILRIDFDALLPGAILRWKMFAFCHLLLNRKRQRRNEVTRFAWHTESLVLF